MGVAERIEPMLLGAAAKCLRRAPESIDPHAPLARYGLDSLSALELCVAIEEATGIEIGEDDLADSPSIRELAQRMLEIDCIRARPNPLASMLADTRLPPDIDPGSVPACANGCVLLTGATGFLGIHLLDALLEAGVTDVICAVRARDDTHARERIRATAHRYGIRVSDLHRRITAVAADLEDAHLGRTIEDYRRLAQRCSGIVHCAADVNWALSYTALRTANVLLTQHLLRFASTGVRKRFHFVSSLAACYSTRAIRPADEDGACADLAGIHLGYAQSKWVAERLVEACRDRGLDATLYRPGLIMGDSRSGIGNDDDLWAQLVRGVVALGYAPDLDWRLDACPVDYVAQAIGRLVQAPAKGVRAIHLRNPQGAHWSEAVLWMNVRGYRVRLEPYAAWIERAERASSHAGGPLNRLRGFLLARPPGGSGRTLPEIYADPKVASVRSERSDALLARLGLQCPRLDARVLERTFDALVAHGALPDTGTRRAARTSVTSLDDARIQARLRAHFADPCLRIVASRRIDFGSEHSILGELASWRAGNAMAMHARSIDLARGERRSTLEIVVKPKYADTIVLGVADEVAALCGRELGERFKTHRRATGLIGNAQRELGVYARAQGALHAILPLSYGVIEADGARALLLERIADATLGQPHTWTYAHIATALAAIGRVHGEWLERKGDVAVLLDGDFGIDTALEAPALWRALSAHAQPRLCDWVGADGARLQADLAAAAPAWMAAQASHPQTLIHHDFNPRNCVVRAHGGEAAFCAFDWELAEFGLPQRDAIEWLCFVLPCNVAASGAWRLVDHHRAVTESAAGVALDAVKWQEGIRLALADFAVRRLPMYCMADRFKPQAFLPRVARTWWRLARWSELEASRFA